MQTLEELADLIQANIILTRYAGQNNRYCAHFDASYTKAHKNEGVMTGTHGNGDSPDAALEDYASRIAGRYLLLGSGEARREFSVPVGLKHVPRVIFVALSDHN